MTLSLGDLEGGGSTTGVCFVIFSNDSNPCCGLASMNASIMDEARVDRSSVACFVELLSLNVTAVWLER